jgi:DNA-binding response OmpR family regulator
MEELFAHLHYLIIDDFEQMRVSFKGMLTSFGAEHIDTCATGEKALKALAARKYDVVICDYNLGDGKDGQQVLEESRHLGYLGHACCFFMITAESNMPMVLGALEQQPDEYMIKPINSDALEHRLANTLKRKHKIKAIDQALAEGDKMGAIELCKKHRGGDHKKSLYLAKLQSELCMALERYDDAEEIYLEMLKIRDFPWANFALAKIDFYRNQPVSAESRFRDLIKKNQHYLEAYDWLAMVLKERGETKESQELLQQAVKLSPKMVSRQRELGDLALKNSDTKTAERSYQAAIRWGEHSCFSSAKEYRQLADIYQKKGDTKKVLRLLADARKRFNGRPAEEIQILSKQARVKLLANKKDTVDTYLQRIDQLVIAHKGLMNAEDLLVTADDLFEIFKSDEAKVLLDVLLCNYHDDDKWKDRVRHMMSKHNREDEVDALVKDSQEKLKKIHAECDALLKDGRQKQALTMLNDTVDNYPANRTIALMSVSAMIDYMQENGVDKDYHFRCRYSLNRLLAKDPLDAVAEEHLRTLSQLSTQRKKEYSVAE